MGLKIDNGVLLSPDANGNYVERAAFNNDGDLVFKNADGSSKGAGITESAGDLRYLQLLGGTVTGAIHANHTSNTFSGTRFSFGSATLEKSGDNNHIHFGGTAIIPLANGGGSIGTSGYRFGGIFSTGANVSGTATLGKAYINGASDNSGKSDFSVYTGGTASLALTGGEFRVGDTDVNWTVALRSSGYLGAYGIAMTIGTTAGDYAIDITPNGTTTASFNQGVTTFHTPITVKGGAPNPETTDGYGLEIMGNYTDGRWNHRFVKHDDGAGVPLYVQKTTSVADVWSNVARFGLYSGNGYEFEVFGAAKVNGDFASTGQINASGGNSSQWNTAYGWGNHSGLYLGATAKAADSNLFDGIDSVNFVYGNAKGTNDSVTTNNDDLDKTGYYTSGGFATRPSNVANWMYIEHIKLYNDNTSYQKQIGYDTYDNRMWSRTKNNGTWTNWAQIWTSDVFSNNSTNWNTAYGWGNHASAGYLTSLPAHTHDDRYYTETEVNTLLAAKSATSHTHNVYDLNNFNSGQDPNTYSQTRIWTSLNGGTTGNYPSAYNGVVNLGMDASHGLQFSYHYGATDDALYFRHKSDNPSAPNGVGWQGWKTLASRQWVQAQGYLTSSGIGSYATQQYVTDSINSLINGAPGALNTLDELAAALGDDANFAGTITNSIATKVSKSGDTMTGNLTIAQSSGNNIFTINSTGGGTPVIYMNSPTRGWGQFVADNNLRFKDETGNIEVLTLEAGGNVGVGLADPAYKLDVSGDINASAAVRAYQFQGNANVSGTGNASYHPSGIYSTSTNWLYGTMYLNANSINDTGDIRLYNSSYSFRARYNAGNDNYHASLNWYGLQLGNNGDNYIVGGRTNPGGNLRFYVNNTSDFTTINGTLSAIMHSTGRTTFGGGTDYGYTLNVAGSFYATDWIRVGGTQGLYFESYGGGWNMTDTTWIRAYNDKNIYTGGYMRAARFEDANDSTYYLDPSASTSLNIAGKIVTAASSGTMMSNGSMSDAIGWNGDYGTYIGSTVGGTSYLYANGTFYTGGAFRTLIHSGNIGSQSVSYATSAGNADTVDSYHVSSLWKLNEWNGNIYGHTDGRIYGTIFYDANDSNYYVDPNGISVLSSVRILNASSGASLIVGADNTSRVYNDNARKGLVVNADYYPHIYVNALSNASNDVHGAVISMTGVLSAGGYRRWGMGIANTDPSALSWGWWDNESNPHYSVGGSLGYTSTGARMWLNTDGVLQTTGSMRAPIFYDSEDTGYYVDPNSESKLRKLWINNGGASGVSWSSGLNMGDSSNYWNLIQDGGTARQRNFGAGGYDWFNNTASTQLMYLSNTGNLSISGTLTVGSTAYIEPVGQSMNVRKVNTISFAPNNGWNDPGVHGIMSTDSAGSSADSISINSYNDITLRLDANNNNSESYLRIMNNTQGSNTIAYIGYDGSTSVAWFGGVATASNDFRAPIFYDSQDTSYYVDPNGSSRLGHLYVGDVAGSNDGSWNARMKVIGSSHARLDVVSNSDGIITTMFAHTGNGAGKMGTWSNHPLKLVIDGTDKATLDSSGNFTVVGRFTETSSQKYKTNIQDLGPTLEKVDQLRGVTYSKIGSEETEIGMIAEEVAQIFPDLISYNEEGQIESLNYTRITAVLVEAVKELNAKVKTQEIFIDNIVARLERLENK